MLFFLFAAAIGGAIGGGMAGAPLTKGGIRQGAFNVRAGLFGAVLAPIGAGIGWLVWPESYAFFIGAFAGGIIGSLLGGAASDKK